MVLLSVDPAKLDLCLQSMRRHLPFIDRIVVLTKREARAAIEAVEVRHFASPVILTDEDVTSGTSPKDHQARNTWLRKQLYQQPCIDANSSPPMRTRSR